MGKLPAETGINWLVLPTIATIYGFEIETTPEQDEALITQIKFIAEQSAFPSSSRNNCADFAKGVLNFYYPKSLHRSLVADVGITTPKQMAKC